MGAWHSPGSIYHIGHRAVKDLFDNEVQIQEKVDGSFFAFGLFQEPCDCSYEAFGSGHDENLIKLDDEPDENGIRGHFAHMELKIRSKGSMIYPDAPPGLFKPAVETVVKLKDKLHPEWQYRGEAISKPKHNALAYDRIPAGGVILFDILTDEETYLSYEELKAEGERLGLEVVPQLYVGRITSPEQLRGYLTSVSVLGGQQIEGVVIKPLTPIYGQDKKLLMGKFVSEAFKEVHRKTWGESNPKSGDILQILGSMYGTQARWQKALQHLREAGSITDRPQDIGLLIREVPSDIRKECEEEIKEALFKWAWPHIARMVGRGLPDWYKQLLLTQQFEKELGDAGTKD